MVPSESAFASQNLLNPRLRILSATAGNARNCREQTLAWEKLNRGVSKPFPTFIGSWLCRGPFRDCSSQVLLIGRERGKGQIRKSPEESPSKSGKSRKKSGKSQKGQNRENPPFEPPRLAALDLHCALTRARARVHRQTETPPPTHTHTHTHTNTHTHRDWPHGTRN